MLVLGLYFFLYFNYYKFCSTHSGNEKKEFSILIDRLVFQIVEKFDNNTKREKKEFFVFKRECNCLIMIMDGIRDEYYENGNDIVKSATNENGQKSTNRNVIGGEILVLQCIVICKEAGVCFGSW